MKVPMTAEGYRALRDELDHLKRVERYKVVQEIEVARAHGDLRENAEYHAAKEKQGFIEGRVQDIEAWLSNADIIEVHKLSGSRVLFGATVTVLDPEDDTEKTYKIVGDAEADLKSGKISFQSPIARALIGKEEGEEVTIKAPGGDRVVEIVSVEFK
jgi:transcription elongation factor GreA